MKYIKYILLAVLLITISLLIMRESGSPHDHSLADGEVHIHDAEDASHTHEADDPAHTHAEDDTAHTHDSAGIPVDQNWESLIGLKTVPVRRTSMEQGISVPGRVIENPDMSAQVSSFVEGSVNCAFARIGNRVKAGDELACLTSPQIGMLRAEYDKANAELEIQQKSFARKKKLFEEKIISEKAWQEAELAINVARVSYDYARKRLLAVGISESEIDDPPTGHSEAEGATLHIHAPIGGVITSWNIKIGQKVNQNTILFEIADLGRVWCRADLFEKHLNQVKLNQKMKITVSAWPGKEFEGRIFNIGSTLNRQTGTIEVLAEIENPDSALKPGMYAKGFIVTGIKPEALVLPRDAVLEDEGLNIVFVREGETYHRHVIETGIESEFLIEVISGLTEGAEIVTSGNYQLKSKLKMQGVDPHAGHVH